MTPKAGFGEDRLVLRGLPKSLLEYQGMFPDEKGCGGYLRRVRWPNGSVCPYCGGVSAREEGNRPLLWGCRSCGKQTSLTSGTVMHGRSSEYAEAGA